MVYVDLGVRAILDVLFDDGEELLKVVFAVLCPDRELELRHVHQKLEGLGLVAIRRQNREYKEWDRHSLRANRDHLALGVVSRHGLPSVLFWGLTVTVNDLGVVYLGKVLRIGTSL